MKNVADKALTARERRFVELMADPMDNRAVGAKALECGWHEKHGYRLARRPLVASAIDAAVSAHLRTLRARVARVLSVLADSAEKGDVRAAELFLQAAGVIGPKAQVNIGVSVNGAGDGAGFPELLQKHIEERRRVLREYRESRGDDMGNVRGNGNGHDPNEVEAQ